MSTAKQTIYLLFAMKNLVTVGSWFGVLYPYLET